MTKEKACLLLSEGTLFFSMGVGLWCGTAGISAATKTKDKATGQQTAGNDHGSDCTGADATCGCRGCCCCSARPCAWSAEVEWRASALLVIALADFLLLFSVDLTLSPLLRLKH